MVRPVLRAGRPRHPPGARADQGLQQGVRLELPFPHAAKKLKADAAESESKIWAKKGVFGKKGTLQDIMCVAFGNDGITYAGTADGHIYRFAEQTMDMAVKAHGEGKELCKVTALWSPKAWFTSTPGRSCLVGFHERDLSA